MKMLRTPFRYQHNYLGEQFIETQSPQHFMNSLQQGDVELKDIIHSWLLIQDGNSMSL